MFEGDEIDPKNFTPEALETDAPTSPARKTHYPHFKDTGIGSSISDMASKASEKASDLTSNIADKASNLMKEDKKSKKGDRKKEKEEDRSALA